MADTKISGLPASTTPLAGTEVLPIVQSGTTKQVSVANLTAGRDVSANIFSSAAGAVATPAITTAGDTNTGIWFPAADTIAVSTAGTERMRIDSAGGVGIGTTSVTDRNLGIGKNITGATAAYGVVNNGQIQSGVTTLSQYYRTTATTAAAAFTLTTLDHFSANQGTIGATSAVTTQVGFNAASSLTGATNNYGFYGAIASGTGRYNFYAAGTAENFFGGNTTISVTDNTNAALRVTQIGTGNALLVEDSANPDASPFVINTNGVVIQDKTTARTNYFAGTTIALFQGSAFAAVDRGGAFDAGPAFILSKNRGALGDSTIVVANDTLGQISFQGADGTNLIPGASISAVVDGTPGLNDMPGRLVFSTTPDGSATSVERMRIASSGNVGIGTTTPNYKLEISTDSAGKPGIGGLWTVVSDKRIKSNIVPANLDRCYEIVKSVPLKHFGFAKGVYSDDQIQDKNNLGWIAQDVQKVFKNAVSVKPFTLATGDVIEDCLDLNGGQMIAALYGAVQALMAIVDTQAARITALEEN